MLLEIRKIYSFYNRERVWLEKATLSMLFEVKKMLESKFQRDLIDELKNMFPGALIYKNESKQGLPDLTVLWGKHWALLECKKSAHESPRPNQPYYVQLANEMSFSRFIYPENKQEVLHELQQAFGTRRKTRNTESK